MAQMDTSFQALKAEMENIAKGQALLEVQLKMMSADFQRLRAHVEILNKLKGKLESDHSDAKPKLETKGPAANETPKK